MGAFDDIIKAAQPAPTPGFFQRIANKTGGWWLRNVTAPQVGAQGYTNQFFQDRRTGNPGVVRGMGTELGQEGGSPAGAISESLASGPSTDVDTIRGLLQLQKDWQARAQRYPKEGMIYISPKSVDDPGVYRHEAAHSLFDQIVPGQADNDRLANQARSAGMYIASKAPSMDATEALAYEVGWPRTLPPQYKGPEGSAFVNAVAGAASTPPQKAAANRLIQLYNGGNALAK